MKRLLLVVLLVVMLALPASVTHAAIVTLDFAAFNNGTARVEFDRNEGNGNVLRFRCINNSQGLLWFGVYRMDYVNGTETLLGERYCYPGDNLTQNVRGTGIIWSSTTGQLEMGNYLLKLQWTVF